MSVDAVNRLLADAQGRYDDGLSRGAHYVVSYWDGYIRALQHVLEMEGQ